MTTGGYVAPPPTRLKNYQVYSEHEWSFLVPGRGQWGIIEPAGSPANPVHPQGGPVLKLTVVNNYANNNTLQIANIDVFGSIGPKIQTGDALFGALGQSVWF